MMIGHAFALFAYSSFSAVSEEERVLLVLEGKAAMGSTVEPRYKDTQYKDTIELGSIYRWKIDILEIDNL
jgi:hypothetical protein